MNACELGYFTRIQELIAINFLGMNICKYR